jgi:NADPH-dependent F420 reductase
MSNQEPNMMVEGVWDDAVAILGGTGKQGGGLALRWARAGHRVIIGSRSAEKAVLAAAKLRDVSGRDLFRGMSNAEAVTHVSLAVLTVPYSAHSATLSELKDALQGKILVDVTVPLRPPQVTHVFVPEQGPAAIEAQEILGSGVRVVSALQNVSEHSLRDPEEVIECDVLVCGDDAAAKAQVIELVKALGPELRAFDAGPLANAVVAESLTPILIGLGRQYKRLRVGVRITGLD